MAGNTNKGVRHPETGDLMTEEKLNAFNLAKFKKSLKEGTLGNTGPLTSGGTSFSPGRWEKYFKENPEQAEKVGWSPSDTIKSYMSRSKNRKTTPVEEPEKQESEKEESEKEEPIKHIEQDEFRNPYAGQEGPLTDKKVVLKDETEGMLTKEPVLDGKKAQAYLDILEKAGVKGARAEKLTKTLLSISNKG